MAANWTWPSTTDDDLLLRVDEALEKLAWKRRTRPNWSSCAFFTGLSIAEAAEALGIAPATAKRHWAFARAWLYTELQATG